MRSKSRPILRGFCHDSRLKTIPQKDVLDRFGDYKRGANMRSGLLPLAVPPHHVDTQFAIVFRDPPID